MTGAAAPAFCGGCGKPADAGDHAPCERMLAYDPPRWCTTCGFRLDVQVYPGGYRSSCRECRRRSSSRKR